MVCQIVYVQLRTSRKLYRRRNVQTRKSLYPVSIGNLLFCFLSWTLCCKKCNEHFEHFKTKTYSATKTSYYSKAKTSYYSKTKTIYYPEAKNYYHNPQTNSKADDDKKNNYNN